MIDPMTAMMIAQLGMSAINMGMGIRDRRVGKDMLEGLIDPQATIPDSSKEALARARNLAASFSMPGQDYLENNLDMSLSSGMSTMAPGASGSADYMNAALRLFGNRMRSQNEIGFRAAENYMGRQSFLNQELWRMGEEEKRLFDINTMQPFMRKMDQAYNMIGNGNNLIGGGSSQAMSALGGYAQNKQIDAYLNSLNKSTTGNTNNNPLTAAPVENYGVFSAYVPSDYGNITASTPIYDAAEIQLD
jgi:hypothetical protein